MNRNCYNMAKIFVFLLILCTTLIQHICRCTLDTSASRIIFRDDDAQTQPGERVEYCRNPNGRLGACISIYECVPLLNLIRKRNAESNEFVRMCQCKGKSGTGKIPYVCCTMDTKLLEPDMARERITTSTTTPSTESKFPTECGGKGPHIGYRILSGVAAELGEFSWMVLFEYRTVKGVLVLDCSGTLIHRRYALTASHCVRGDILVKVGKLESVRIGEHNTETEDDCNEWTCIPRYQRFYIEKLIVHENYGSNKAKNIVEHNDIALVRLNRDVLFDEYVQPICLPYAHIEPELRTNEDLVAAGWGHTGLAKRSSVKLTINLPLFDQPACRSVYAEKFHLTEEQFCAGGLFRKDTCSGDSGGPLMRFSNQTYWVLEGIVSFGIKCGLENKPGIYTRVRSYLDWIDRNVE